MVRARQKRNTTRKEAEGQDADELREFLAGRYYTPELRAAMLIGRSENDAQTSLRLPRTMYDALDNAAAEHGVGLGEEIRLRLEMSFLQEEQPKDEKTGRLLRATETVADNIEPPFGKWHGNRFAFDTFRAGVLALIDLHRPAGVPVRPKDNEIADMYLGEEGTTETAGRMIAGGAAVAARIPLPGERQKGKGR